MLWFKFGRWVRSVGTWLLWFNSMVWNHSVGIGLNFGTWNHSAGEWLLWDRLYSKDYEWTPVCRIQWRHIGKHGFPRRNSGAPNFEHPGPPSKNS